MLMGMAKAYVSVRRGGVKIAVLELTYFLDGPLLGRGLFRLPFYHTEHLEKCVVMNFEMLEISKNLADINFCE